MQRLLQDLRLLGERLKSLHLNGCPQLWTQSIEVECDLQVLVDAEADMAARDSTGGCALLKAVQLSSAALGF